MRRVAVTYGDESKLPPYERALRAVGLDPVRNPDSMEGLDGLLLSGGTDVDPALYGEEREEHTQSPDQPRDRLNRALDLAEQIAKLRAEIQRVWAELAASTNAKRPPSKKAAVADSSNKPSSRR